MSVETGRLAPDAVRSMFDRISPVYDAMNRTMTAGLDQRWRRATVAAVVRPGDRVLDACCGTGDLAVAASRAGARVTGLDFSERMLERARGKSSEVEWVQGDAQQLPFEDAISAAHDLLRAGSPPAAVEADRHDAVHQVVHRRDAVEHRAHALGGQPAGLGAHSWPQRRTSSWSRPSWSRQRATMKSTRSSTDLAPW